MTATMTYNAETARLEHPRPWIPRREAVVLCIKFGVSEYKWRDMASGIPRHPQFNALYSRDALIGILQG